MRALSAALGRQQATLVGLLIEAGVLPERAGALLLDVLTEVSAEAWERMPQIDLELLRRVDAACREYAAHRERAYQGLNKRAARQAVRSAAPAAVRTRAERLPVRKRR